MRTRILVLAALAAALVPAGSTPAHAMSACQVKPLGTHSEFGQFVLVAGVYKGPADAAEVHLTCGIVRYGVTIDRVSDATVGPVATLADVHSVGRGPLSSCYEIKVVHVDGSVTYQDTCP